MGAPQGGAVSVLQGPTRGPEGPREAEKLPVTVSAP